MSDWGATHSTAKAANAGLDMQMPDATFFGAALKEAVSNGQVSVDRINGTSLIPNATKCSIDMVLRILIPMFAVGLFDNPQTGNITANAQSAAHTALARTLST